MDQHAELQKTCGASAAFMAARGREACESSTMYKLGFVVLSMPEGSDDDPADPDGASTTIRTRQKYQTTGLLCFCFSRRLEHDCRSAIRYIPGKGNCTG